MPDSEDTGAEHHGHAHDDVLTDPLNLVLADGVGGVEEVLRGLLERGQHQHAALHLRDAVSRDAQNLALHRHQQHMLHSLECEADRWRAYDKTSGDHCKMSLYNYSCQPCMSSDLPEASYVSDQSSCCYFQMYTESRR